MKPSFFLLALFIPLLALSSCGGSSSDDRSFPSTLDEGNSSSIGLDDEDFHPVLPGGNDLPGENTSSDDEGESDIGDSSSVIDDFLWKPESESDGNVAVLVNPRNVRIEVNGDVSETLRNTGASNGRGTTARGRFPGCRYGDGVIVEFFSSTGARIRVKDGRSAVKISDGCDRVEFKLR